MVGLRGQLSHPKTPVQGADPSQDAAESDDRPTKRGRTERQKQTRLTSPEIDELLARRAGGATIAELAALFVIHRTTVMAHLKRNIPLPSPSG